jgi:hypothetical protein
VVVDGTTLAWHRGMNRSGVLRSAVAGSLALAVAAIGACSDQQGATSSGSGGGAGGAVVGERGTDAVGRLSLNLDIGPGIRLTSFTYAITGPHAYGDTVTIGDAQSLEFVVGGILAGGPYTLSITGTDSAGDMCSGVTNGAPGSTSAPFNIVAGALTQENIAVTCVQPPDGSAAADVGTGSLEVDAAVLLRTSTPATCPGITSFSISPAEVAPGQSAALALMDTDPAALITWSVSPANGGVFGAANASTASTATTSFACTNAVPQVTVTATLVSADAATLCAGKPFQTMSALVNCEPQCTSASTCPASLTACIVPVCNTGACGFANAPEGTTCSDGGGTVCDGIGDCVPFTFDVARIGSGVAITGATTAVFLEKRNVSDGSLVSTITLPTSADAGAAQPFTVTGTSVTDGDLARSVDGRFLAMGGFAAAPGVTTPSSSTSLNRVIARIDASGHVDTSTVMSFLVGADVLFGGGTPRSAASIDGSGFWVTGDGQNSGSMFTGGLWYVPFGAAGASITNANQIIGSPLRAARIFGGQLYADGDTAATPGVFEPGTGIPTSGPQTPVTMSGLPSLGTMGGYWSFLFFDLDPGVPGVDTFYLAASAVLAGDAGVFPMGIVKYTLSGGAWSQVAAFGPTAGARGLAGLVNPVTKVVTLITSTVEKGSTTNHVDVFTDNGGTITAGPAVQSGTNTLYRGVALTPHP